MDFLTGLDRVETPPAIGRPVRMGTPAALRDGDAVRVRTLLQEQRKADATAYLLYLYELNSQMVASGFEWLIRWPHYVKHHRSETVSEQVAQDAFNRWLQVVAAFHVPPVRNPADVEVLGSGPLSPDIVNRSAADDLKRFSAPRLEAYLSTLTALRDVDFKSAQLRFETYLQLARNDHDLILEYVWSYATSVKRLVGEGFAQEALAWTLQSSPSYLAGMELVKQLPPHLLTAALAEHLRGHFSGKDRDGAVEIVEESDHYRLVLHPCGSGGAMRRKRAQHPSEILDSVTVPTSSTWGEAHVPLYCAHCAQNEANTAKLLGYPAWIAEFNPDPHQPCAWKVYKDPKSIPAKYFDRVGLTRP